MANTQPGAPDRSWSNLGKSLGMKATSPILEFFSRSMWGFISSRSRFPIPAIMDDSGGAPNGGGGGGGGVDLISTLPDDLLVQVLERLGSAHAAMRTGLVSRRWRDLWTRLPKVTVALHDVPLGSLEDELRRAADRHPGMCHYYLLDIRVPEQDDGSWVPASSVSALLGAAAALLPVELRLALPLRPFPEVNLPRFCRAASIDLRAAPYIRLALPLPSSGGFTSLKRLSLSGCHVDLAALIPRCPCLRVLTLNIPSMGMGCITIHSPSLHELVVESSVKALVHRVDVHAPVLKQLTFSFCAGGDLGVSMALLAPTVLEKVAWHCSYTWEIHRLGIFGLSDVGLIKTQDSRHGQTDDTCSSQKLPIVNNVLSLHMCAQLVPFSSSNAELRFPAEINKHMITSFSTLDLHLRSYGHVFGALVFRLFGIERIRKSIRNLRIVLLISKEVKVACPADCLCDEPKDWRTSSISLPDLEKVELGGVQGKDHEINFLKVIIRRARLLKSFTMNLSEGVTPSADWCTKINNFVKAYPIVECKIDLGPGSTVGSQSCPST